jgi:peptidoglycan-N-acetylglucosamine deacetylase
MTRTGTSRSSRLHAPAPGRDPGRRQVAHARRFILAALLFALVPLLVVLQARHWWHLRAYEEVAPICRVQTETPIVALTFDDGPDPAYTPTVLELLATENAHATFFVIGERVVEHPDLVADIVRSRNELANHTWSHPRLASLSQQSAIADINRGASALENFPAAPLLRAPYGEISPDTLATVRQQGFTPVHWSVPLDHFLSESSPDDAAVAIAAAVSPGDIILAHDAHDGGIDRDDAIATLGELLPLLRSEGYQVVSVSTLLENGVPVLAEPRPWLWQTGFSCPPE